MMKWLISRRNVPLVLVFLVAGCAAKEPVDINVNAASAMIAEAGSGRVLYEKAPEKKSPPASTSKVMTAIVAIENASLDKKIIPTKNVLRVEPTVAGLRPGVEYELKDLLGAILVKSANDAAVAIAEGIAGSEEGFAGMMNAKAKKLGMKNTYFANASGLPTGRKDRQHTTAEDLVKMMRYARRYRTIQELMSKRKITIMGSDKRRISLKTHNGSLFTKHGSSWGKTGYTREARRTFVGTDPSFRPRIVLSLLKSNSLWKDISTLKNKGLRIYEIRHRSFASRIMDWVRAQRQKARREIAAQYTS